MKTSTETLAAALHILANDIQSVDGVANAAILEAALRLEEQGARIKRLEEAGKNLRECAGWLVYPMSWSTSYAVCAEVAIKVWDKEAKP